MNDETLRPFYEKLNNLSEQEIEFLKDMFKWLEGYFDESKEKMKVSESN
jgi:hypothetical protein